MQRVSQRVALSVMAWFLATAAPASADFIGLTTPLTGSTDDASFVDLSVDLDLNGSAQNIVGQELYVVFSGLVPILDSYTLGSVFLPFGADVLDLHGVCADFSCGYPADDPFSASTYVSLVNVFAPSQPTGPGSLFGLRFAIDPFASAWSLNVLGDEAFALLADACSPGDAGCGLDPLSIPFQIVTAGTSVPSGTAQVQVNAAVTGTQSVPEPGTLLLLGMGMLAFATHRRAALRR